jgi:hypothetical protein
MSPFAERSFITLSLPFGDQKQHTFVERITGKFGWSLDWVSALDSEGRTIWFAAAHRGHGKRFVVRADEKLTAFLELKLNLACGDRAPP